jgi:iron complex transport system permease protein
MMMPTRPKVVTATLAATVLVLLAFAFALGVGSVPLASSEIIAALTGPADGVADSIVRLRLDRAISAFATGGLLAVAGTLMQALLRNPLADPYILGVSGGAAGGALTTILLGLGGFALQAGAFLGAAASTLLVLVLAHGRSGDWSSTRLLLTGVVVASGWGALIAFMLSIGDDGSLRSMLFWLMGDFSLAPGHLLPLLLLVVLMFAGATLGRHLNVLARGEDLARSLGLAVQPMQVGLYLCASLITAVAVTEAGAIGFVGLVVPHAVRMLIGMDHRALIPTAALAGGAFLVVTDTLARTLLAPRQLPVGVLTAALGVPVFLALVRSDRNDTR